MKNTACLPLIATAIAAAAMLYHGPIAQLPHYHDFADSSRFLGIPHAADVLSNLAFAVAALWGFAALWRARRSLRLIPGIHGYGLFVASLLLTAAGSSYYHLDPDNARLVWDRLPIALACAGLLSMARSQARGTAEPPFDLLPLTAFAVFSVAWWRATNLHGAGDLRPYLLLQAAPLVLIPLWQWIHHAPRRERAAFAAAIALYVAAKAAELHDRELLSLLGCISGHTIKHLLSAVAAGVIVRQFSISMQGCSLEGSPRTAKSEGRRLGVLHFPLDNPPA